jgi:hypothetical protein
MPVQQNIRELLEKLGVDPDMMQKADAITDKHSKISKSKLMVREMMSDIIMFIHNNRATILPYTTESYAVINETKTEDEMLIAYLNYIINDFNSGANISIEMARFLGFDKLVEAIEKERVKREADIAANPEIEMI